jgi:four helix bundle protein
MPRACASVPANIAEGFGRWNSREFTHFLSISSGSLRELETHLVIACRLGFLSNNSTDALFRTIDDLARMLYRMRLSAIATLSDATRVPAAPTPECVRPKLQKR